MGCHSRIQLVLMHFNSRNRIEQQRYTRQPGLLMAWAALGDEGWGEHEQCNCQWLNRTVC